MRVTYRGPHTDGVVTEWGLVVPGESIEVPGRDRSRGDFETGAPAKPAKKKESD